MSATLLTRVKNLLDGEGLLSGYSVRYFRWTDADADGSEPLILFRQSGSGPSDIISQETRVNITLVATPTTVFAADTRAQAILRLLRDTDTVTGVTRFDPEGTVRGPMYLENGRPVFDIVARCYTEDQ